MLFTLAQLTDQWRLVLSRAAPVYGFQIVGLLEAMFPPAYWSPREREVALWAAAAALEPLWRLRLVRPRAGQEFHQRERLGELAAEAGVGYQHYKIHLLCRGLLQAFSEREELRRIRDDRQYIAHGKDGRPASLVPMDISGQMFFRWLATRARRIAGEALLPDVELPSHGLDALTAAESSAGPASALLGLLDGATPGQRQVYEALRAAFENGAPDMQAAAREAAAYLEVDIRTVRSQVSKLRRLA